MKKNKIWVNISNMGLLGAILTLLLVIIFYPFITFWCCYLGGMIAQWLIGNQLIDGLKYLNINIQPENIPLIAGVLGWIGHFFYTTSIFNKDNN